MTGLERWYRGKSSGAGVALLVCAALAAGCARKQVIETTLDTMSAETREETFQDMARVFDENPEWVDEFYEIAREHPPTMTRFLQNAVGDLDDEALADETGDLLAQNPRSLRQVLISTVDAAKDRSGARAAINGAIRARNDLMTDIMTDEPETMASVFRAMVRAAGADPEARRSLVAAMEAEADRIVDLIASNPDLAAAMAEPMIEALDREHVLELLEQAAP